MGIHARIRLGIKLQVTYLVTRIKSQVTYLVTRIKSQVTYLVTRDKVACYVLFEAAACNVLVLFYDELQELDVGLLQTVCGLRLNRQLVKGERQRLGLYRTVASELSGLP